MRTAERRSKPGHKDPATNGRVAFRLAGRVDFPAWITDHESFRRWARSPECPEKLRVAYYDDGIWVDADMEQFFAHNQVKAELSAVLVPLARTAKLGRFAIEGMLLSNPAARLSTVPDGFLVSYESVREGRLREVPGKKDGCIEYEGTAEMVLEVVSDSSEQKDLVDLVRLYWLSGVREYWLVDARGKQPQFEILKRGPKAVASTRRQPGGWLKSEVFGRSFRLAAGEDELGEPLHTLEVK